MKYLFLSILFGKYILLTSNGVTIGNEWFIIELDKPIKAATTGAFITIQLPTDGILVQSIDPNKNIYRQLRDLIPNESITVRLENKKDSILLLNQTFALYDSELKKENSVQIMFGENISPGIKFDRVKIKSNITLANVKIGWRNFGKK